MRRGGGGGSGCRVSPPYPRDSLSKAKLKPRKKASKGRARSDALGGCSWCGLKSRAQSAGLRVSETKSEKMVEAAIVTPQFRENLQIAGTIAPPPLLSPLLSLPDPENTPLNATP